MAGKSGGEKVSGIREGAMEALGRITSFWGFGKAMGQIYGLLYLSPSPLTLDDMCESLSISKGGASLNVRALERWNMVRRVWVKGDRKDYWEAETDFWRIVKGVLREREKKEFDQALSSIGSLIEKSRKARGTEAGADAAFVEDRLKRLEDFVGTMDRLVALFLTLEDMKKGFSLKAWRGK